MPFLSSEIEAKFRLIGFYQWGKNLVRSCMQALKTDLELLALKPNDLNLFINLYHQFDMNIELLHGQILQSTSALPAFSCIEQVLLAFQSAGAQVLIHDQVDFTYACARALKVLSEGELKSTSVEEKNENLKSK